tara:strand:- start:42 stop:305 length:264 start_codon:yes stop_codon:yes gene_type:complete
MRCKLEKLRGYELVARTKVCDGMYEENIDGRWRLFNEVGDEIVSEIMPCKVCGRDTPVPEGWSKFGKPFCGNVYRDKYWAEQDQQQQ